MPGSKTYPHRLQGHVVAPSVLLDVDPTSFARALALLYSSISPRTYAMIWLAGGCRGLWFEISQNPSPMYEA